MKKITQRLNASARKVGFVAVGVAASSSALATTDEAVTAAFTKGETSYGLAVAGIIGLAAVGVAVSMIIGMMRKS